MFSTRVLASMQGSGWFLLGFGGLDLKSTVPLIAQRLLHRTCALQLPSVKQEHAANAVLPGVSSVHLGVSLRGVGKDGPT